MLVAFHPCCHAGFVRSLCFCLFLGTLGLQQFINDLLVHLGPIACCVIFHIFTNIKYFRKFMSVLILRENTLVFGAEGNGGSLAANFSGPWVQWGAFAANFLVLGASGGTWQRTFSGPGASEGPCQRTFGGPGASGGHWQRICWVPNGGVGPWQRTFWGLWVTLAANLSGPWVQWGALAANF